MSTVLWGAKAAAWDMSCDISAGLVKSAKKRSPQRTSHRNEPAGMEVLGLHAVLALDVADNGPGAHDWRLHGGGCYAGQLNLGVRAKAVQHDGGTVLGESMRDSCIQFLC